VPPLHTARLDQADREMIAAVETTPATVTKLLEEYRFREALFEVIMLSDLANKYMQKKEPWIVVRTLAEHPENQQLIDNCLHICLQVTANLAILIHPFLPFTAKRMLHLMKVVEKMLEWENAGKMKLLSVGYSLRPQELLFRPIEDAEVKAQVEKLRAAAAARAEVEAVQTEKIEIAPIKPEIVYDDFAKLDFRVGTILAAEKVEKADKLLKLSIDLGSEQRVIVSGIAQYFKPEELVGHQVVVVANLAPRKMRGIESNGMILMAEDPEGRLHFIQPDEKIAAGSGVS
jgi:methionyl-tRNA synthetase